MPDLDAFSPDYATARRRFREAASKLGWETAAFPIGATGPEGEELTVDVASSRGDPAATLVVSSGLHGVEGFFGSAVQLATLEGWAASGAPTTRCVFLHALNPYGFAWMRRADAGNVDPNRNFLLSGQPYKGAPEKYAALDPLLNPPHPPRFWKPLWPGAALAVARHGMRALRQAVAGGQYDFPRGLFYGGDGPCPTQRLLEQKLPGLLAGCRDAVHLDFHTGLGGYGTHKLLLDHPLTDAMRARLTDWYGADSFVKAEDDHAAYRTRGGLGRWCHERKLATSYLYLCAEFGTYAPLSVLAGLRTENQAHHYGTTNAGARRRAKGRLAELFGPASPTWRRRTLAAGVELIERAAKKLASVR